MAAKRRVLAAIFNAIVVTCGRRPVEERIELQVWERYEDAGWKMEKTVAA